jgi:2-oxoisovalerate dehydrogenase E1 component
LSIGQEAAAVGECLHLGVDDHIFGSHRSHGEVIAKGLRAVQEDLAGKGLDNIMTSFWDGVILRTVEGGKTAGALKSPARRKSSASTSCSMACSPKSSVARPGSTRAWAAPCTCSSLPFGIYPNNALVGGSADIATGSALYKKVQQAKGITIANIGDASLGCGPVWEALGFSAMGQFDTLWEKEFRGGLPMVFNFMNNFYGMGGQPIGETMGFDAWPGWARR